MLLHELMGWVHSKPQINVEKLYNEEKGAKRARKPAASENFFSIA